MVKSDVLTEPMFPSLASEAIGFCGEVKSIGCGRMIGSSGHHGKTMVGRSAHQSAQLSREDFLQIFAICESHCLWRTQHVTTYANAGMKPRETSKEARSMIMATLR
jgi:hypothetical protein